jgi:hypothetical protein
MADDRDKKAEFRVYEAPYTVVIERVASDQEVRCTQYDGDEKESPHHPDTTTFAEPFGLATRPPIDTDYLAVATTSGDDWLLVANADRPAVNNEGGAIFYELYESGGSWVTGGTVEIDGGDVKIAPRSGKVVYTTAGTRLGDNTTVEKMLLGNTVTLNFGDFLNSWLTHLATLKAATALGEIQTYCDNVTAIIGVLKTDIASWKSAKHYLDE